MNTLMAILVVGVGATLVMDVWGWLRKPLLGMAVPDYRMVGRWVGHMAYGKFCHAQIRQATPIHAERWLGLSLHYLLGLLLAAGWLALVGKEAVITPSLTGALAYGLVSVLLPFLVVQPAMGAGFAFARTERPASARLQSLLTHLVFGFGLWLSAWLYSGFVV